MPQKGKVPPNVPNRSDAASATGYIAGCFDNIAHEPLLSRIPVFQGVVRRWLKAGVVEHEHYEPTEAGTPQGGVISPLLANIALDGIERLFAGKWWARVVRYADDFVVVAATKRIIDRTIRPAIEQFLAKRGLELHAQKTGVVNLDHGFNFLGFTFRRYGGKLLITPQKERVQQFMRHLKAILVANKQVSHRNLLILLNPVVRGWGNYYRYTNAKNTFGDIDHRIWETIWSWCTRRHPMKGKRWVKRRYFMRLGARDWVFGERADHVLYSASRVRVNSKAYVKVKGYSSPFDPALRPYWERRLGRYGKDLCS